MSLVKILQTNIQSTITYLHYDIFIIVFSISLKRVDEAMERLKKSENQKSDREASVLEKLLKIDRKVAVVMAMDMLLAGVDTVSIFVIVIAKAFFLIFINLDLAYNSHSDVLHCNKSSSTRQIERRNFNNTSREKF